MQVMLNYGNNSWTPIFNVPKLGYINNYVFKTHSIQDEHFLEVCFYVYTYTCFYRQGRTYTEFGG